MDADKSSNNVLFHRITCCKGRFCTVPFHLWTLSRSSLEIELTEANDDHAHTVSSIQSENVLYYSFDKFAHPPLCSSTLFLSIQLSQLSVPAIYSMEMVHGYVDELQIIACRPYSTA